MVERIKSPCVGICSAGIGDAVCRGCKRFSHEVIAWNTYSELERRLVRHRLDRFLTQVVEVRLELIDTLRLRRAVETYQLVEIAADRNPYCQIQELLQFAARRIQTLESCGFRLRPDYSQKSLTAVRDDIDQEFWRLSQAHFDRYVAPGIVAEANINTVHLDNNPRN